MPCATKPSALCSTCWAVPWARHGTKPWSVPSPRWLGLDERRLTHALGIAATQASGLRAVFGSDSKSLHTGKAARDGLAAALLAERSFTSSLEGIEGKLNTRKTAWRGAERPRAARSLA
jgi:2-methylcitrate dehydratase PrpD